MKYVFGSSAKIHCWLLTCLRGKCCEAPVYEQMATALYSVSFRSYDHRSTRFLLIWLQSDRLSTSICIIGRSVSKPHTSELNCNFLYWGEPEQAMLNGSGVCMYV